MFFDNIAPAHFIIKIMKISGLGYIENDKWNRLYRVYAVILHLVFTFLFVLAMYINVTLSRNDINQLSDALYMSLTETALIVKVTTFLKKTSSTREFFEIFEKTTEGIPRTRSEKDLVQREHNGFCRLRNSHAFGTLTVITIACVSAFLARNLPFPCWIPFGYDTLTNFYFAYSYVAIGITVTALTNVAIDLCQAYFLFQISIYYKILGKRLERLGHGKSDADIDMKNILKFHSFIVNLTKKCEKLISLPVMVQICMSAFVICFTAYRLNNMHFLDDPSNFIVLIVFGFVMALQIYLPCSYGNELTINAYNLTNAIYNSNWYNLPIHMQKDIYIYMEYLKRPVVVRAGNFFEIGLRVFTQTLNNAYTLYALLVNIGS